MKLPALRIVGPADFTRIDLENVAASIGAKVSAHDGLEDVDLSITMPVVLLLLCEEDEGGIEVSDAIQFLAEQGIWWPVVAVGNPRFSRLIVDCIRKGALDFLPLSTDGDALKKSIVRIMPEVLWQSEIKLRQLDARKRIRRLTGRERQVLDLLSTGAANKDAAYALGLSPRTVEIHRANMLSRLNVRNASEAISLLLNARD